MDFIPLIILGVFILIIYSNITAKSKAEERSVEIDEELIKLKDDILVSTGSSLPTKEIRKSLGLVRGLSEHPASSNTEFVLSEKEALLNILLEAKKVGANAIIDLKLDNGTYQQRGSKWQMSQAVYIGTAVRCY